MLLKFLFSLDAAFLVADVEERDEKLLRSKGCGIYDLFTVVTVEDGSSC
jgi:hypothetical protein